MKNPSILFVILLLILSCSSEPAKTVDFKEYTGIWVPYEIIHTDKTIEHGPFMSRSIFAVYAESLQLKSDNTYTPVIWQDKDHYSFKIEDAGKFEYVMGKEQLLLTEGAWNMSFKITKYGDDDLLLTYTGDFPLLGGVNTQYKFKREVK